jgi:hypothetical protein
MNPESRLAFTEDIHPAVLETFHLDYTSADSNAMNRLVAFGLRTGSKKDQPEGLIAIDAAVDHRFVPVFKDVEWNDDVGKQDEIREGEQSYLHLALPKSR